MPLIAWLSEYEFKLSKNFHNLTLLSNILIWFHLIWFSASSGNKKAKTKQSQNNNTTETIQETKSQEIKPINNKSITPTVEEQTNLITDIKNSEDVSTNAENKNNRMVEIIPDKQGTGKCCYI